MKNVRKLAVGVGVAAVLVVGWVAPATSGASTTPSTTPPKGYTVVIGNGGCELATIDLTTGTLTDLPAGPSTDACATDLAVSPSGTVYGIADNQFLSAGSVPGAVPAAQVPAAKIVTFAADGTPSAVPITDPGATAVGLATGGIAVSPAGTVYVQLVTDNPTCLIGTPPDTTPTTSPAAPGFFADSVCLYTVSPATGTAAVIGTTNVLETPFFSLAWCGGLHTLAFGQSSTWGTESTSTGAVTLGAVAQSVPVGYDCDSRTGGPLWGLSSPNATLTSTPASTEVDVTQIDPATGAVTQIVPVSDQNADLIALAVVATPEPEVANANVVAPSFTG